MRKCAVILCGLFIYNSIAFAGAWTQKKGGQFLKLSAGYMFTETEFDHNGNEIPLLGPFSPFSASFRDINLSVYYEYGFTDDLTIIGKLPFKSYTTRRESEAVYQQEEVATTTGFADLTLLGRYGLYNGPVVISTEAGVKIPLGYSKNPGNDGARLGTGDVDYEGFLLVGGSLHPMPIYFSGGFGYRIRGGELNDEFLFIGEAGYTSGQFFFKTFLEAALNTNDPPDKYGQTIVSGSSAGNNLTVGDEDIVKISPSITYQINPGLGIQVELIHALSGKSTLSSTTYSFGIIFN